MLVVFKNLSTVEICEKPAGACTPAGLVLHLDQRHFIPFPADYKNVLQRIGHNRNNNVFHSDASLRCLDEESVTGYRQIRLVLNGSHKRPLFTAEASVQADRYVFYDFFAGNDR